MIHILQAVLETACFSVPGFFCLCFCLSPSRTPKQKPGDHAPGFDLLYRHGPHIAYMDRGMLQSADITQIAFTSGILRDQVYAYIRPHSADACHCLHHGTVQMRGDDHHTAHTAQPSPLHHQYLLKTVSLGKLCPGKVFKHQGQWHIGYQLYRMIPQQRQAYRVTLAVKGKQGRGSLQQGILQVGCLFRIIPRRRRAVHQHQCVGQRRLLKATNQQLSLAQGQLPVDLFDWITGRIGTNITGAADVLGGPGHGLHTGISRRIGQLLHIKHLRDHKQLIHLQLRSAFQGKQAKQILDLAILYTGPAHAHMLRDQGGTHTAGAVPLQLQYRLLLTG